MGLLSTGYGFSGLSGPVLVWLISQYGWRDSLVIAGVGMMIVGIPLGAVFRHRPEPYGYLPDGETEEASDQDIDQGPDIDREETAPDLSAREALKTRPFWILLLFSTFTGFAQSAIFVHEMPYLTSVGISRETAGWAIPGMTGLSIIGRLSFSWIGDNYDKRYLLAIGATLQLFGVLVFAWIGSPGMLIPFIVLFGIGYASQIPLFPAIQVDYFGLKSYATIRGLQWAGWSICGILAPVLAGWVYDVWGIYRPIWLAYAIANAVAIPLIFLMKPAKKRKADLNALRG